MRRPNKEDITRILANHEKRCIADNPRLKSAAVLIPLFEKDGEFHILLMKRSDDVEYHKGQISFPGGGRDACDLTMRDTALREAYEEVGLNPEDAEIIGELDDCHTATSDFRVAPFVAVIPYPYQFRTSKFEVKELLDVPLSLFLNPDNYETRPMADSVHGGTEFFVNYAGHIIWGATAGMLRHFADLLRADAENRLNAQAEKIT